jgi:tetratricopeptide (TPR) repeat protein
MTYQENTRGKLRRQTSRQAILFAMEGRWQEAVEINKGIIEHFPNDVDAHNRLGKAYMELNDYTKAKESYSKALQLDQYNSIAKKNLQRLSQLTEVAPVSKESNAEKAEPHLFIEEIGKAGVVNLSQTASRETLLKMMAGDKVILEPKGTSLAVETVRGDYLGLVPAKQGQRLAKLMEGGNKYTAAVVSSDEKSISVIIREIYQDPSQIDQVSFPGRKLEEIQPYPSDRVFRPEYEEEEEAVEVPAFVEEGAESNEEPAAEEHDTDKEWEQES